MLAEDEREESSLTCWGRAAPLLCLERGEGSAEQGQDLLLPQLCPVSPGRTPWPGTHTSSSAPACSAPLFSSGTPRCVCAHTRPSFLELSLLCLASQGSGP